MITGYNTEVPFGGITYHVQTEDMGVDTKKIITHVFKGGAILLSKKTPYDHLVAEIYDENRIKALMNDQHKTFLRVIQAGKLEVLRKKIEDAEAIEKARPKQEADAASKMAGMAEMEEEIQQSVRAIEQEIDVSLNSMFQKFIQKAAKPKKLKVEVVAGTEIVSGQPAVLRVYTKDAGTSQPLPETRVVIKVIGMTFRPERCLYPQYHHSGVFRGPGRHPGPGLVRVRSRRTQTENLPAHLNLESAIINPGPAARAGGRAFRAICAAVRRADRGGSCSTESRLN